MSALDQFSNPDELIDFLVARTPENTTTDTCCDALLVEYFFPLIGPRFQHESDIYEDDIERFKEAFPYEKFGLNRNQMRKTIDKLRSIRAIIDKVIEALPIEVKNDIAKQHIKRIWFEENAGSDFEVFKKSINPQYWQLQQV